MTKVQAVRHWFGKHATIVLFVITLGALAAIYENQQQYITELHQKQEQDVKAGCKTALANRADYITIFGRVIEAVPQPALRANLQLAINHAFDEPPAICKDVDLSTP